VHAQLPGSHSSSFFSFLWWPLFAPPFLDAEEVDAVDDDGTAAVDDDDIMLVY
jgi:hypothetical protein